MRSNASDSDGDGTPRVADHVADVDRVVIVGGGHVGRRLAEQFADDRSVHHVDEVAAAVARPRGYETSHVSDVTSTATLAETGVTADDVAIVLTGQDSRTLLVTQLLRTTFGVERVYAVLIDPRNRDAFDITGVTLVCGTEVVAEAVLETSIDVVALGLPSVADDAVASDVSNTSEHE